MLNVTLPKSLITGGDLVVISRRDYERFIAAKRKTKSRTTFVATARDRAALARGRRNFAAGRYRPL